VEFHAKGPFLKRQKCWESEETPTPPPPSRRENAAGEGSGEEGSWGCLVWRRGG